MNIEKLRTNHLENPIGYLLEPASFSWIVTGKTVAGMETKVVLSADAAFEEVLFESVWLKESNALHDKLVENVNYFRDKMTAAGFDIKPTQSAICAVMLYDAKLSQIYAARMQEEGIYVTGFYYPVVPKDQARIRVQISAGHEKEHLDKCIAAFIKVGKELGVLK